MVVNEISLETHSVQPKSPAVEMGFNGNMSARHRRFKKKFVPLAFANRIYNSLTNNAKRFIKNNNFLKTRDKHGEIHAVI